MKYKIKYCILYLVIIFGWCTKAIAQKNNFQNWNSISAKIALGKKSNLQISELGSFSPSTNFQLNYTQSQLSFNYKINKALAVTIGDQLNYTPTGTPPLKNRIFLRGTFNYKLNSFLKAEHALQVEFHDKNERFYSKRFIFINKLSLRNRFSYLHLQPSISYWLYYNIGGNPIQYYDMNGNPTVVQTPDGFHRGRLNIGLNSKINKSIQLSAYYLKQQEFNLFTSSTRNINIVNPNTGKIKRPFNDYNVFGLSLQFFVGNKKKKESSINL